MGERIEPQAEWVQQEGAETSGKESSWAGRESQSPRQALQDAQASQAALAASPCLHHPACLDAPFKTQFEEPCHKAPQPSPLNWPTGVSPQMTQWLPSSRQAKSSLPMPTVTHLCPALVP